MRANRPTLSHLTFLCLNFPNKVTYPDSRVCIPETARDIFHCHVQLCWFPYHRCGEPSDKG